MTGTRTQVRVLPRWSAQQSSEYNVEAKAIGIPYDLRFKNSTLP